MIEQQIYDLLNRCGVCSSEEQFSIDFLGKSRKYFGVCKARRGEVSLEAKVTLLERILCLEEYITHPNKSPNSSNLGRLKGLSKELANLRRRLDRELSNKCLEGFNLGGIRTTTP